MSKRYFRHDNYVNSFTKLAPLEIRVSYLIVFNSFKYSSLKVSNLINSS